MKAFRSTRSVLYSDHGQRFTAEEAARHSLTPGAYSYDGRLEQMSGEIDLLRDMVAALVDKLYEKTVLIGRDVEDLCGGIEEDLEGVEK